MKQSIQNLGLFLFLMLFTLPACKEESLFSGKDNYILEFSLRGTGDAAFEGRISGDEIKISVPGNIPLNTLTPNYALSEHATISPKPESIGEWKEEQLFTVTSHNGTSRRYHIKIVRLNVVLEESVYLLTDKDVADFAEKGVTVLNGNLFIGASTGKDSISSLESLASLGEIKYRLVINATYRGKDLKGLENLQKVGSIEIKNNNNTPSLQVTLAGLETVVDSCLIESNAVTGISLPKLENVGSVKFGGENISSIQLPLLKNMEALTVEGIKAEKFELPDLENCEKNIKFDNLGPVREISFPKLKSIQALSIIQNNYFEYPGKLKKISFPGLKNCKADIYLSRLSELERVDLNALEEVKNITLSYLSEVKEVNLPQLTATGNFTVEHLPLLERFVCDKLERCNGGFTFFGTGCKTVAFPALKISEGDINIFLNPLLSSLSAPVLEEVEGTVNISENPEIKTVRHFFRNIRQVASISIMGENIDDRELDFSRFPATANFTLQGINLKKLVLPKDYTGALSLKPGYQSGELPEITGSKSIGTLEISGYEELIHLMLPGITQLTVETIYISNMSNLATIDLSHLTTGSCASFTVQNTPKLEKIALGFSDIGEFLVPPCTIKEIALKNLETLDNMVIEECDALSSIDSPRLTTITGVLILKNLDALTRLDFLSSVESLESVELAFNANLTDYSGLKKAVEADGIMPENWNVYDNGYNPTIEDLKAGRYVKP